MATLNQERAAFTVKDKGDEVPTIKTLNIIPQKVI